MTGRTPLVIVGAGGLGREVAATVRAAVHAGADWSLVGFLDDSASLAGTSVGGLPVLGPVDAIDDYDAMVAVAVASDRDPGRRRDVVARLGLDPGRVATIVHPQAAVSACSSLGAGTILLAHCVLTADVSVGDHVVCMPHVANL